MGPMIEVSAIDVKPHSTCTTTEHKQRTATGCKRVDDNNGKAGLQRLDARPQAFMLMSCLSAKRPG
eukprot:1160432-Pelagomonas_calceolata.AAC.8